MTEIVLRDYQLDAERRIREAYQRHRRAPCLVMPTGGGKTAVAASISKQAKAKGSNVLILVHRRELVRQTSITLDNFDVEHGLIQAGVKTRNRGEQHQVYVASVQTLVGRMAKWHWRPDLIIVDECFPAGTTVDGRAIESLRVGDIVKSFNDQTGRTEEKPVLHVFKSRPSSMVRVHFDNGPTLDCTAGHPIYVVGEGYVSAKDISRWSAVLTMGFESKHVVRVEVIEQARDVCPDGYVYNIEVADNNNYFADGVLVHNCHHTTRKTTWGKVVDFYDNAKILGVTATPQRLDGHGLGQGHGGFFDELIYGPSVAELTARGNLSPAVFYAPTQQADLSSLHTLGGDYKRDEMSEAMDKPTITGDAVQHYKRICPGEPAIAFCSSVAHAEHVAEAFRADGYRAASVDGGMDSALRAQYIADLGAGRLHVLCSCEIISEGVDVPVVSVAILLRPTQSLGLYLQQIGRVLRPFPGKTHATILDHVGNVFRHGFPADEREWSLEGKKKGKKKPSDAVPVKQCPECYAAFPPAPVCPRCGHVMAVQAREIEQVDGTLEQLDPMAIKREMKREQGSARTLDDLVVLGKKRGYKNPYGWANFVIRGRGGVAVQSNAKKQKVA